MPNIVVLSVTAPLLMRSPLCLNFHTTADKWWKRFFGIYSFVPISVSQVSLKNLVLLWLKASVHWQSFYAKCPQHCDTIRLPYFLWQIEMILSVLCRPWWPKQVRMVHFAGISWALSRAKLCKWKCGFNILLADNSKLLFLGGKHWLSFQFYGSYFIFTPYFTISNVS